MIFRNTFNKVENFFAYQANFSKSYSNFQVLSAYWFQRKNKEEKKKETKKKRLDLSHNFKHFLFLEATGSISN